MRRYSRPIHGAPDGSHEAVQIPCAKTQAESSSTGFRANHRIEESGRDYRRLLAHQFLLHVLPQRPNRMLQRPNAYS